MSKKIGICTYGRDTSNQFSLPAEYVDAVRRANGTPLLIPPCQKTIHTVLDTIDAIILTGGGDIAPHQYQADEHESIYNVDHERDHIELELIPEIIKRKLPTLAICRGLHVLNVAMGGKLHVHLPDVVGEQVKHLLPPRESTTHEISLSLDSYLGNVLGKSSFVATSWHHQGIAELAPNLRAVAFADDGVIEGVELNDAPWLLAVQWHPELTALEDGLQQKLFDYIVNYK